MDARAGSATIDYGVLLYAWVIFAARIRPACICSANRLPPGMRNAMRRGRVARTKLLGLAVVAIVGVAACKKSKPTDQRMLNGATAAPALAAIDGAQADKLWALAPNGTFVGAVLTGRGAATAVQTFETFRAQISQVPALGEKFTAMYGQAMQEITGNPMGTLTDAGLAPGAAAAFFGKEQMVLVLPVVDRDKFVAAAKGQRASDLQNGVDVIAALQCAPRKGFYVCASSLLLLDQLGSGSLVGRVDKVGSRGDLEVVVDFDLAPPNELGLKGTGALTLQLGGGQVLIRGVVPRGANPLVADRKISLDTSCAAGFILADIMPLLKAVPGGNADKVASAGVDGRFTAVMPAGRLDVDARLMLTSAAVATAAIGKCDAVPSNPIVTLTADDGICNIAVPSVGATLQAWVQDNQVRVARDKFGEGRCLALPRSALGTELADGSWHAAMWGRGFGIDGAVASFKNLPMGELTPAQIAMAVRLFAVISEMGVGIDARPESTRFVVGLRTIFSNPPAVVAELQKALATMANGQLDSTAFVALAKKYPSSDFASDYAAGPVGLMVPVAAVGALAAIAVPAFVRYRDLSRGAAAATVDAPTLVPAPEPAAEP